MSDSPEYNLDTVALDIFDLMRRQPGDTFSPDALAEQLGFPRRDIETGLAQLGQLGFINRSQPDSSDSYILSPGAPEL